MLKKRLVGVVVVKDGWAVQSFGYERYLPLGKPEVLVENLDRWGADEIILQCIGRYTGGAGPDLGVLERVSAKGLSTPLIYAGGIRNAQDAVAVVRAGADRICVDSLLHDAPGALQDIGASLGAQAVIASLPLGRTSDGLMWFDYRTKQQRALSEPVLDALRFGAVSEALVIDWRHEGQAGQFDNGLLSAFPVEGVPLIAFGGISEPSQLREVLQEASVSAVAVGNFLNYREHAIHHYKLQLVGLPVRPSIGVPCSAN